MTEKEVEITVSQVAERMRAIGARCIKSAYRNGMYVVSLYSDVGGKVGSLLVVGNGVDLTTATRQALYTVK